MDVVQVWRERFGGGERMNDDGRCKDGGGGLMMVLMVRLCVVMLVSKYEAKEVEWRWDSIVV